MDSAINRLAKQYLRKAVAVRGGYQLSIFMSVDSYQDLMLEVDSLEMPRCRICGCTDDNACPGGCSWAEDDLCSECVETDRLQDAAKDMLQALENIVLLGFWGSPESPPKWLDIAHNAIAKAKGENNDKVG